MSILLLTEEEEEDEEWLERLRILDDARKLKQVAEFFLLAEKPVATDATACGRCFFERPSAEERTSGDEMEYLQIIADAKALKKAAVDYGHREINVETDCTAYARCFFGYGTRNVRRRRRKSCHL